MEVYIDESGYTGEDLVNLEQPVFVLASTTLTSDVSKKILAECFAESRAAELKHSVLGSRPSGQKRIVQFVRELKRQKSTAATFIVHKKYALVTKIVDWWIEPAMRRDGIDLYNRGANIGLSHLIYCILDSLLPGRSFHQHLVRFQRMTKTRTWRSYKEFWDPLYKAFHEETDGPVKDILVYLLGSEGKLGFQYLLTLPTHPLDVALTCALQIVQHWRDISEEPLIIDSRINNGYIANHGHGSSEA